MFGFFKSKKEDRKLLLTGTEELYMPVRLYYKIHNKHGLLKAIKKLKCICFAENDNTHFAISYFKEAKKLDLGIHYQDVPSELYPINLADCYLKPNSTLCIDLKSLRRAVEIINFLHKYIRPQNAIELTHFAHSNQVTTCRNEEELEKERNADHGILFDSLEDNTDELIQKIKKRHLDSNSIENKQREEALDILNSCIQEEEGKNYPAAEKLQIQYKKTEHDEMINMLTFRSVMKEQIAIKRHGGDKYYSSLDAITDLLDDKEDRDAV